MWQEDKRTWIHIGGAQDENYIFEDVKMIWYLYYMECRVLTKKGKKQNLQNVELSENLSGHYSMCEAMKRQGFSVG